MIGSLFYFTILVDCTAFFSCYFIFCVSELMEAAADGGDDYGDNDVQRCGEDDTAKRSDVS